MTPTARACQILIDATIIASLIDPALTNLDLGLAGWPSTTPGAGPTQPTPSQECPHRDCTNERPCQTHGDDVALTATERLGLQPDTASRDLDQLREALRQLTHHSTIAAILCQRWGYNGIDDTSVKSRLSERFDEMWCKNCARAGLSTVKLEGRTECRFCESVRQNGSCGVPNPNHYSAPKQLLDIHATGRKVNSADFTRCMTNAYGPTWNKKIKKGRAA